MNTSITIYFKKTAKRYTLDKYETEAELSIKNMSSFVFKPESILDMCQEEGYYKLIGTIDNDVVTVNAFFKL